MKRILTTVVLLLVILACILGIRGWRKAPVESFACSDCNILVIDIDPLRLDAVHAFGNAREITPFLDSFAKQSISFNNAVAVSSWTLPSAMSLMTGTYPSRHGIINKVLLSNVDKQEYPATLSKTAPSFTTLAEELKAHGYTTAGFAGGAALDPSYGFNKGFDAYESPGEFEGTVEPLEKALSFINLHKNDKFFVFVQGFDVHGQYIPKEGLDLRFVDKKYSGQLTGSAPEQKSIREDGVLHGSVFLTNEDVQFLRSVYDEKVTKLDSRLADFFQRLEKLQPSKKTIIIFTSDHGEEFYEHGRIDHGMTLYDEVIRVPLLFNIPQKRSQIISQQIRNIDIAPTILEIVGITPSAVFKKQLDGTSIVPMLQGKTMNIDTILETSYRYATFLEGVRTHDGWKFIRDEEHHAEELYNIPESKGETQNLIGVKNSKETKLLNILNTFIAHRNR